VFPLQSPGIFSSELDAPEANRFATDGAASLGKQIFDVAVTQVEAIVQLDSVADDIGSAYHRSVWLIDNPDHTLTRRQVACEFQKRDTTIT
jgi:hypothetical protein